MTASDARQLFGPYEVPLTLDESIGVFNKVETKMLVLKIRMTLQEYGVEVSCVSLARDPPRAPTHLYRLVHLQFDEHKVGSCQNIRHKCVQSLPQVLEVHDFGYEEPSCDDDAGNRQKTSPH